MGRRLYNLYMKIRSFFSGRNRRIRKKHTRPVIMLKGEQGKKLRRALIIAGAAAAVILLALLLRPEPVLMNSAEIANVWNNGVLRVGLRNDVPSLAENGTGLEWEIAQALAERIMSNSDDYTGDIPALEAVEVTSMSVGAKLRDGSIDAAICLMPSGANAAYAYSRAYYDDPCYILVKPGNENADMSKLKVGCIQSASSSNLYVPSGATRNLLFSYYSDYKDSGYDTASITGYASYTDLFDALDKGQVDAIAINELMLNKYGEGRAYAKHTADIGTLHYAVATLSTNSAIATVADMLLSEMGY